MSKNFYISDLHLGHKNCLSFDNRPFMSIEEQDKKLIENWNSVVSNNDTVYILGDMFWYKADKAIEILKQLNGKKGLSRVITIDVTTIPLENILKKLLITMKLMTMATR